MIESSVVLCESHFFCGCELARVRHTARRVLINRQIDSSLSSIDCCICESGGRRKLEIIIKNSTGLHVISEYASLHIRAMQLTEHCCFEIDSQPKVCFCYRQLASKADSFCNEIFVDVNANRHVRLLLVYAHAAVMEGYHESLSNLMMLVSLFYPALSFSLSSITYKRIALRLSVHGRASLGLSSGVCSPGPFLDT